MSLWRSVHDAEGRDKVGIWPPGVRTSCCVYWADQQQQHKSYTKKKETRYTNAGLCPVRTGYVCRAWRLRCWAACVINNDDGVSFLYPPSERETEKAPEEYCPSPDGFFMSVAYYADRHRHWNRHNNLDPKSVDVSEWVGIMTALIW